MTPREATEYLGGVWRDGRGLGPCPVPGHGRGRGDLNWSLSIGGGQQAQLLVHCFAGCDPRDVLSALREDGAAEVRAYRAIAKSTRCNRRERSGPIHLWRRSVAVASTAAEAYLRGRGLTASSPALRFLPAARHPSATGRPLAALLCAVSDNNDDVCAVQRTFLNPDGSRADVSPGRMMLGRLGQGAVRLAPGAQTMGLAEGVETAMSASLLFGLPVWAACGTRLAKVELPPIVRAVTIFADHDPPGAGAAVRAAQRLRCQGLKVEILRPRQPGQDWNDVLLAEIGDHDPVT